MTNPASFPRRLAFLLAVPQELAPMARALKFRRAAAPELRSYPTAEGAVSGLAVLLLAGGMGPGCAGRAAAQMLQVWQPDLVIVAGVAGSLSPGLKIGDLVAADAVLAGERVLRPAFPWTECSSQGPPLHRGALLSLDRVLVSPEEKRAAFAGETRPLAVEMETAGAALAAERAGVPWAALRAISDTADERLPLDFNRLRTPDGGLPVSRVALAAIRAPHSVPGLLRLGRNTARASEALAAYVAAWLKEAAASRLPASEPHEGRRIGASRPR